jgi:predicted AAA+ superfamily ATPase
MYKNRQEVDLILDGGGGELKAVEIKYKKNLKSTDYKGLKSYRKAYPNCRHLFMVNLTNNLMVNNVQHLSPFDLGSLI